LVSRRGRPRLHSLRRILDAIFYVVRTGCPWRYLPSNYPPWQAVFYHFRRFRLKGTWHVLYTALHRAERERVGRNPDPSAAILDSQSVKTVEESAGICGYDAHKSLKGRKRHLSVDTLGLPVASYVTPADVHDTAGARKLLGRLGPFVPRLKKIWADAAPTLLVPIIGRAIRCAHLVVQQVGKERVGVVGRGHVLWAAGHAAKSLSIAGIVISATITLQL
jgi:putative transposase